MNRMDLDYIQDSICYRFENLNLLVQAFTRKSFSEENPGTENNEVLEFYGDEVLDLYVTKLMYKETGKVSEKGFVSTKSEGELTKLKAAIVNKKVLASCIQNFGFEKYLLMGNGDIRNNVQKTTSVREDLFEAIIGAVAIGSFNCTLVLDKMKGETIVPLKKLAAMFKAPPVPAQKETVKKPPVVVPEVPVAIEEPEIEVQEEGVDTVQEVPEIIIDPSWVLIGKMPSPDGRIVFYYRTREGKIVYEWE